MAGICIETVVRKFYLQMYLYRYTLGAYAGCVKPCFYFKELQHSDVQLEFHEKNAGHSNFVNTNLNDTNSRVFFFWLNRVPSRKQLCTHKFFNLYQQSHFEL